MDALSQLISAVVCVGGTAACKFPEAEQVSRMHGTEKGWAYPCMGWVPKFAVLCPFKHPPRGDYVVLACDGIFT